MDIMIDLETFGTTPGCVIRSIGAVTFELGRPEAGGAAFIANISPSSCLDAGLLMEQGTVDWWNAQSAEARAHLEGDQRTLREVALAFGVWFSRQACKYVWAQGANFDPVLWEAACRAVKLPVPWRYYNVRDTRTLYDLAGLDTRTVPRAGVAHSALDDARHQVACCQVAHAKLKPPVVQT